VTTATELARQIRAREVSPVEVMDTTLRRIEARNPRLNAFVHLAFDEAMAAARAAERTEPAGPLHGVPTALKDLFDFKPGWPATMGGIRALRDYRPPYACSWCERMERAGAIVVGKTNSPSMGLRGTTDNYLFGPTRNPHDTARNAGGSSGGAAAAVADGMLTFAEATDGGGSARIPAAWCGVYGYKQSWGRVPAILRPNAFGGTDPFLFEGVVTGTVADRATRSASASRSTCSARSTVTSPGCGSPTARTSTSFRSTAGWPRWWRMRRGRSMTPAPTSSRSAWASRMTSASSATSGAG
jgi:amidase